MSVFGVSDLWKIFEWANGFAAGKRAENRKRAEAWLDAVYADINDLSDIWLKISIDRHLTSPQVERANKLLALKGQALKGQTK